MPTRKPVASTPPPSTPLVSLARQLRGWADNLVTVAGQATDMGLSLAQSRLKDPKKKAAVASAGRQLRQWREAAGLTLSEVSSAVGLGDSQLIEQAEGGTVSLPFEVVLRLAAVLGRRDPVPVVMALTRQYNPDLWRALESLGIGKLAVQGTRERELANIYRGSDTARKLDDQRFSDVLAFTRQAFELAVAFSTDAAARDRKAQAVATREADKAPPPKKAGARASVRPTRSAASSKKATPSAER
jgi:transcriptional regulator with XRE-family HTH domain